MFHILKIFIQGYKIQGYKVFCFKIWSFKTKVPNKVLTSKLIKICAPEYDKISVQNKDVRTPAVSTLIEKTIPRGPL